MKIPVSRGRLNAVDAPMVRASSIGVGLSQLGQTVQVHEERVNREQQQAEVTAKVLELQQYQQDQAKTQYDLDSVLTTDFSDYVANLKNSVGGGNTTAQQADEALSTWSTEKFQAMEQAVPIELREDAKKYWDSTVDRQRASFVPLQLKANEQQGYAMADQFIQLYSRPDIPRTEGEGKLKLNLERLGLPQAYITEQTYKYNVTRDENEVGGLITKAFESSDIAGLQALRGNLKQYKYLNGDQMQNFDNSIASRIGSLQQRAETLENKRVTEAGKVLNDFVSNVMTGLPLDATYFANVSQAVQGTEYQAQFDFYQSHSKQFQNFAKLSTSQQLEEINRAKLNLRTTPTADAKALQDVLGVYERIYSNRADVAKSNPTMLIKEQGIETPEITPALLTANPVQFASNIGTIGATLIALQKKDPNVVIKPISPEQLPQLKQTFDGMSVNQKLSFIGNLIDHTRSLAGGEKIWGATLGQLGSGDSTYVMAGIAKFYGYQSNYGVDLATALVSGNQLLKNNQIKLPEDEMRTVFNESTGNTLTGDSANKAYEAYKATYAYMLNQRGITPTDPKNPSSEEKRLMKSALSVGVGEFYSQGDNFKNYLGENIGDWKVPKPYGMSDERFEAAIERGYGRISKALNMSAEDLKGFRLRPAPSRTEDGGLVYTLHYANGTYLNQVHKETGKTVPVFLAVPRNQ